MAKVCNKEILTNNLAVRVNERNVNTERNIIQNIEYYITRNNIVKRRGIISEK